MGYIYRWYWHAISVTLAGYSKEKGVWKWSSSDKAEGGQMECNELYTHACIDLWVEGVVTTHIKHQIACEENGPCCLLEGPKSGPFVSHLASLSFILNHLSLA